MQFHLVQISKQLSYVLRHRPDSIGLTLDKNGWADTAQLIALLRVQGYPDLDLDVLRLVVAGNDKQRFALSADQSRIRANQGHSQALNVDLALKASLPPARLYHGTQTATVAVIQKEGLKPMRRQHVHLSADLNTAAKVATRRGQSITILTINAERMNSANLKFYKADNGVWLTDHVPAEFITFPQPAKDLKTTISKKPLL